MDFVQAQLSDLEEIILLLERNRLEAKHINKDNLKNCYLHRENNRIVAFGGHFETFLNYAREMRSVAMEPKNPILTKRIINFISEKMKEEKYLVAYAVLNKITLARYVEFLKKSCNFEEAAIPIKSIIPRYKEAAPDMYKDKMLLIRHLYAR
jgi:hypothetical protein